MKEKIVLYGKPGCHLCEDARLILLRDGLEFEEVDITTDPGLQHEYGVLIPVVTVEGRAVFMAGMNPEELPNILADARSANEV